MSQKPLGESTTPHHSSLAVVLQVRAHDLQVLLWQRAPRAVRGRPGRFRAARSRTDETLESSIRRHLAAKVDVRELAHVEQLGTWSDPGRHPTDWEIATAYLGLVPARRRPARPGGHAVAARSARFPRRRSTTARSWSPAWSGCARSSPIRTWASRSRPTRSRSPSCASSTSRRSGTRSRPRTSSACCCVAAPSSPPGSAGARGRAAGGLPRSSASASTVWRSRTRSRRCVRPA